MRRRTRLPEHVLVLDDDAPMSRALRFFLAEQGYVITEARSGREALHRVLRPPADLVLLDTEGLGTDEREICRRLRERVPGAGIVVVKVWGGKREKIRILEAGADAYITKPINFAELLARLRVLSRPIETAKQPRSSIVRGPNLELDLETQTLRRLGGQIHLSPTESSLLAFLMQKPG